MMYLIIRHFGYLLIILTLFSCKKSKDEESKKVDIQNSNGVFIINEGNYGWGNGSVSYYNIQNEEVTDNIYKDVNGYPLGDVCQSITYYNNKYYIVVNNSNKIEIVNSQDFKNIGTIHNLKSPRYFLPVNNNKAYISDLYDNKIAVVNLSDNQVEKYINCIGSTEEMLLFQNNVFVTNTRTKYIYIINTISDCITDSIMVGASPFSILIDKNKKIWILCSGNTSTNGSLYKLNSLTYQVEKHFDFTNPLNIWNRLKINSTKDTLYFINNGVFQLPVNSENLPQSPIIPENSFNFYGLGIEPDNGNIFVSDAIDYVQKGKIYIYNQTNGNLLKSFNASIIPGDFIFN